MKVSDDTTDTIHFILTRTSKDEDEDEDEDENKRMKVPDNSTTCTSCVNKMRIFVHKRPPSGEYVPSAAGVLYSNP